MGSFGTVLWFIVALGLSTVVVEEGARYVYQTAVSTPNECTMTYMGPQYIDQELATLPAPYRLFEYRDYAVPPPLQSGPVTPVLFVPGNGGSYKQARSLGHVALDQASARRWLHRVAVYTLDFNEELVALRGRSIWDQVRATEAALAFLDRKYSSPTVIVGHSMGGCVAALAALKPGNSAKGTVAGVIGLSSPFAEPPFTHDGDLDNFYEALHAALTAPGDIPVMSLVGGVRDSLVAAHLGDVGVTRNVSSTHGYRLTVHTASVPGVLLSTDHQCIVWCREVVEALADVVQALAGRTKDSRATLAAARSVNQRLQSPLPAMFIDRVIPYIEPGTSGVDEKEWEKETLFDPARLPVDVVPRNETAVFDLGKLRARHKNHVLLRARVEGLATTSYAIPHVLLCPSHASTAGQCRNVTASWTLARTRSDPKRQPYTHLMWLSAPALAHYRVLRVRVRGIMDEVLVQAFESPRVVHVPSPTSIQGLFSPTHVVVPAGHAAHLTAPLWRKDHPLALRVAPGAGPHMLVAVHTPRSCGRHAREVAFVGTLGGSGSRSVRTVTLAATFDPRELDVFIVPTSARSGRVRDVPLELTLQLDVPALLGGLYRAHWFTAFAVGAALVVLAHTHAVLADRSLLGALAVQFPVVTIAVTTAALVAPRPAYTPEAGLFLCAAGFFAAFVYLAIAYVLYGVLHLITWPVRFHIRQHQLDKQASRKSRSSSSSSKGSVIGTVFKVFFVPVVAVLLATVWPFYVLIGAVFVLLVRAALAQTREQRTLLLGAVAATMPALLFAASALLDRDSPVFRPGAAHAIRTHTWPQTITVPATLTALRATLHGSEPAALLAALHALIGARRPLLRTPRLLQSFLIIAGAIATITVGAYHAHLAPVAALIALLLV